MGRYRGMGPRRWKLRLRGSVYGLMKGVDSPMYRKQDKRVSSS